MHRINFNLECIFLAHYVALALVLLAPSKLHLCVQRMMVSFQHLLRWKSISFQCELSRSEASSNVLTF